MKKSRFTLVMFALMAATATQAQVLNQYENTFNGSFGGCASVPAKYSSDGKAYLVTTDEGDKNTQLSVYDDKLNKVKTIDIAEPENARSYSITRERGKVTKVVLEYYDKNEWPETEDLQSVDDAKAWLANNYGCSIDSTWTSADTTYLFTFNPDYYFYHDDFGRMYPTEFFAYSSDGKMFQHRKYYDVSRSYTGEWKETKKEYGYSVGYYPKNIHIMNYNESPDYEEGITLTQTLFNNDDAYEYIMPVFTIEADTPQEDDRDGDGETDYISTYYGPRANAFKVVSDNGNTLQTVDMPTGLSFDAIYLLNINDEQYLLCSAHKKELDYYSIFYTIGNNGGSTQIQQVGEPMRTRVHPTVAGRNETITVELDGNGNGEKEIFVSNAAGQTVYKSKVAAGQKQVLINASGLSRGMNIISVRGGKGKTNSNKVIVK